VKNHTDLVTSAAPTAAARVRLRPVDARGVAIRDGLLADRQRVTKDRPGPVLRFSLAAWRRFADRVKAGA
jgi:hypothetical protein